MRRKNINFTTSEIQNTSQTGPSQDSDGKLVSEYTLIRAKKIDYLEQPAIAIYFQSMTKHLNQLRLESQVLEEKNRVQMLESYTSTISHEFRTPLSTSLMFLENLLRSLTDKQAVEIINLIVF